MKKLKKYLTFTNIIAIFSFAVLMLFFCPCFTFTNKQGGDTPDHYINLFHATFGTKIPGIAELAADITLTPCAGLIIAFVFLIIGIGLSIAKNRIKYLGFAASAFYITSGVLIACAVPLIVHSNYGNMSQMYYYFKYFGWAIAIATLICFAGFCQFIDAVASIAKPKVQEVY